MYFPAPSSPDPEHPFWGNSFPATCVTFFLCVCILFVDCLLSVCASGCRSDTGLRYIRLYPGVSVSGMNAVLPEGSQGLSLLLSTSGWLTELRDNVPAGGDTEPALETLGAFRGLGPEELCSFMPSGVLQPSKSNQAVLTPHLSRKIFISPKFSNGCVQNTV